ncbi:unnamed protein product [Brassica rapa]|uniref:Uncharacterized protein n=1 Tax=Brassica campestris TaxID=3711 RepID=A0A8D9HT30_BRACM|nr:unnamed protein product [Brassica rapa]
MAYPSTTHPTTARSYITHVTIVHQSTARPTTCHPTTTHPSTGHQPTTLLSTCWDHKIIAIRTEEQKSQKTEHIWRQDVWKIMKKVKSFLVLFMKLEPKT